MYASGVMIVLAEIEGMISVSGTGSPHAEELSHTLRRPVCIASFIAINRYAFGQWLSTTANGYATGD